MPAHCYLCDRGVGTRPGTSATADPHGVCGGCGVFACEGHCLLNRGGPRVECVICVPTLVAASTAFSSMDRGQLAEDLRALLERLGGQAAVIRSVQDFIARYPDFAQLLAQVDQMLSVGATPHASQGGSYYQSLDGEQRRLLLLAIVILRRLQMDPDLLPPPVRLLYTSWL